MTASRAVFIDVLDPDTGLVAAMLWNYPVKINCGQRTIGKGCTPFREHSGELYRRPTYAYPIRNC
jgi:hypothetical protein